MSPKDRSVLRGFGEHILDVLANHTTDARWGEWMWAPFERAAANDDVPLSCALFKAGATGPHLHPAVRGDHGTLVSELLKLGAAPSARDEQGDAALHVAAGERGGRGQDDRYLIGALHMYPKRTFEIDMFGAKTALLFLSVV